MKNIIKLFFLSVSMVMLFASCELSSSSTVTKENGNKVTNNPTNRTEVVKPIPTDPSDPAYSAAQSVARNALFGSVICSEQPYKDSTDNNQRWVYLDSSKPYVLKYDTPIWTFSEAESVYKNEIDRMKSSTYYSGGNSHSAIARVADFPNKYDRLKLTHGDDWQRAGIIILDQMDNIQLYVYEITQSYIYLWDSRWWDDDYYNYREISGLNSSNGNDNSSSETENATGKYKMDGSDGRLTLNSDGTWDYKPSKGNSENGGLASLYSGRTWTQSGGVVTLKCSASTLNVEEEFTITPSGLMFATAKISTAGQTNNETSSYIMDGVFGYQSGTMLKQ